MKNLIFTSIIALFTLVSCGGNKQNNNAAQAEAASEALSVDALFEQADALVDQQVVIEGVCSHACRHGATKIFLMGSDNSQLIRCQAGEFRAFKKECVHSVVRCTGVLKETRMDEEYLVNWKRQYEEAQQLATNASQLGNGGLSAEEEEAVETASGCETESKARGEQGETIDEKIAAYREQIAARKEKEGKEYLSFYHLETISYEIVEE